MKYRVRVSYLSDENIVSTVFVHEIVTREQEQGLMIALIATTITAQVESGIIPIDAWQSHVFLDILEGPAPSVEFYHLLIEEVEGLPVDM